MINYIIGALVLALGIVAAFMWKKEKKESLFDDVTFEPYQHPVPKPLEKCWWEEEPVRKFISDVEQSKFDYQRSIEEGREQERGPVIHF